MAYVTPHTWTSEQATVALMNEINNNLKALFPVGKYIYVARSATTAETFIDGVWLECNGVSVLRATYPDLNTLLSGLSYPFGTVDGTHMTLPDLQGRDVVAMSSGGHADVNALGDSDGVTKANRTPKHNSTNGVVLGGSPGGGPFASDGHTHTTGGPSSTALVDVGSAFFAADASHGHSTGVPSGSSEVTIGSLGVSGTIGPGGTRPMDTGTYLVGGVWLIKAVA